LKIYPLLINAFRNYLKETSVNELKKFHKDNFDIENIYSTASELKYSKMIKQFFAEQLKSPSDEFVKTILNEIYEGVKTQNIVTKFRDVIKKSLNDFITELMNEKIKSALNIDTANQPSDDDNDELGSKDEPSKIITTMDEIEAFYAIKSILLDIVDVNKISFKDTESYLGILYDNNSRKWICRINLDGNKKYIIVPDENKNPVKYPLESINNIYAYKEYIIEVAKRYVTEN